MIGLTEIDKIKKAIRIYRNSSNEEEFQKAYYHLKKVKSTYGTIDISLIKEIIR